VFVIPENDLVLGVMERRMLLAPAGLLLSPEEELAIGLVYSAGRVPKSLYYVRAGGALP
jgi:hypothetical protein